MTRPRNGKRREVRGLTMTKKELDLVEKAGERAGRSRADFIRRASIQEAKRELGIEAA